VVEVIPSTLPPTDPLNSTPSDRKLRTTPGPRTSTSAWPPELIPCSFAVIAPLQALFGSPWPVIMKPFSRNEMRGAPNVMHGAPVTMHVTLPTSRLSSLMIRVLVIRPLMSSAAAATG
jgi:hypothetical protein